MGQALGGYPPPPQPFDGRAEALEFFLFAPYGATMNVTVPPFPPPGPPARPAPSPPLYVVVNLGQGASTSASTTTPTTSSAVTTVVSPSPSPSPTGVTISLDELLSEDATAAINNIVTVIVSLNETAIGLLADYLLASAATDCDVLATVFVNATTVAVSEQKGAAFLKGFKILESKAGSDWPSCLDATATLVETTAEKTGVATASDSPSPSTAASSPSSTVSQIESSLGTLSR